MPGLSFRACLDGRRGGRAKESSAPTGGPPRRTAQLQGPWIERPLSSDSDPWEDGPSLFGSRER